jgi:DEAD/DEAH box helicase domain-containing protein
MRVLTFDIETIGVFDGPMPDFSKLEVSVVGVHDSTTGALTGFYQEEFGKLWPLLESADVLVGYNSEHFDIPILNRYYAGDLTKIRSVDLLKEVKNVLGRRLRLDNLAEATLGRRKTGHGSDAGKWWAAGLKEKVLDYCLADVKITRDLYDYARMHGHLKYRDFADTNTGKKGLREIKLDTSTWEAPRSHTPALTHTLPF